jgi:single-stranded DNA-binding protein
VAGDPIVTVARNGQPYANFRMFTNVPVLKRNGQWTELVEVHNVSAFGHTCNYVKNNVAKGGDLALGLCLH